MIKPAATSASSSLALALGGQAASGEDGAVSADFAALLESSLATGQDPTSTEAAPPDLTVHQQLRQDPGNAAGKKLPLDLPVAAAVLSETTLTVESPADDARPAEAAAPVTTEILLPGLALPIASPLAQASVPAPPEQSAANSLGRTTGQTARAPMTNAAETAPAAKLNSTADTPSSNLAASDVGIPGNPVSAPASARSPAETALPATALAPAAPEGPIARPAPTQPGDLSIAAPATPTPARSEDRTGPNVQADASGPSAPAVRIPAHATAWPTAGVNSAPASPARAPQSAPIVPSVAPGTSTNDAANLPAASSTNGSSVQGTEGESISAQTSNSAPQSAIQVRLAGQTATAKPLATAAEKAATPTPSSVESAAAPANPTPQPNGSAQAPASASQPAVSAPKLEAAAPDATAAARAPSTADAPATPTLASAPVAQPIVADGQSSIQTAAPIATAPTAGSVAQSAHDFATLVDRLVEAREAAMPEAVKATITHGDFGPVSLRFQQDAGGLSVAMSSADPEFANAVQAAASSGQSQTANEHGSTAPRQDAPGQQPAGGSSSGQSQASARNDKNGQAQGNSNSGRPNADDVLDEGRRDPRGGIYA